jgi:hypothetical protein
MQYQDNNMNEVFQRAAENYLLKKGDSNWDTIASALSPNPASKSVIVKKSSSNKISKQLLTVLLFLFAGSLTGIIFYLNNDGPPRQIIKFKHPVKLQAELKENNGLKATGVDNKYRKGLHDAGEQRKIRNKTLLAKYKKRIPSVLEANEKKEVLFNKHTSNAGFAANVLNKIIDINFNKKAQPDWGIKVNHVSIIKENKLMINQPDKAIEKSEEDKEVTPLINRKLTKQKGIYAVLILGVGFSEVKSQKFTKPGLLAGLRAGYRVNNRFSIETGVLFGVKHYYSNGKYFYMDKISSSMPTGMQVISLSGTNAAIEFPLKINYHFPARKYGHLFSSAGFTSYLIKNEKNNYNALINGTKQTITSIYTKPNHYLLATFDLSLGFEYKMKNNKTIQIEPFLQFPLKGVGVGRMPVMTTGLQIGYSIFKH